MVAPGVSLASWWHGPWISEVGRTLTSLFGGLGIALKSVHGTDFALWAFGVVVTRRVYTLGRVRLSAGRAEPTTALRVVSPQRLLLPPLGGLRVRLPVLSRCPLHVARGEAVLPGVSARVASVPCSAALLAGWLAAHATQLGRLRAHVVV